MPRRVRNIADVLNFRGDLSPFLVHLTKDMPDRAAGENLHAILSGQRLRQGGTKMSVAAYGIPFTELQQLVQNDANFVTNYLSGISFTETPLGEIHSLLEIRSRTIDLKPYGLVFLKSRLERRGVEPVIYLNNHQGDKDPLVRALCSLVHSDPETARKVLPLLNVFGRKLMPAGAEGQEDYMDFLWEREWRYRGELGDFHFDRGEDVFLGLCPHDEIDDFEAEYEWPRFIDPYRNMKWYARKLIDARRAFEIKDSVV